MSKVVIIGAGKTGRGFLARLMREHDIIFIDKNQELINALNNAGKINISFFGNSSEDCSISFKKALTWENVTADTFKNAEAIFTAVGGSNLTDVGNELKKYITKEDRIIVCENASKPAKKLYDALQTENIRIAESTVFCTTIEKENSYPDICSEYYPCLQYDGDVFLNNPNLSGIQAVNNFGGFLDRKLFTYNSASCVIAYLGAYKGYTIYSDAANDPEILSLLDYNYDIINECICKEYGYTKEDQKEFALLSRIKFTNKVLVDTIARNAREPQRKLIPTERIVAPMLLEIKYGKDSSVLEKTLAAALLYHPDDETVWNQTVKENGYEGILTELCGLSPDSEVFKRIVKMAKGEKPILTNA